MVKACSRGKGWVDFLKPWTCPEEEERVELLTKKAVFI